MPSARCATIGLGTVDRLAALKHAFIGAVAGFGGEMPKLLRGPSPEDDAA